MDKYRKKPVVIEAVQITVHRKTDLKVLADWCGGRVADQIVPESWRIAIDTLERTMYADANDWIIRGVKGEFYPCKPDIFDATYERVDDNG